MSGGLDYRLLGPFEVMDGERRLPLGGAKQRSVLAILLLDPGEVVSSDRLIDLLWGDDPPEDASTALQQHVSRLRRVLAPHEVLVTRSPGYLAAVAPEQTDVGRFSSLRRSGREHLAAGRATEAAEDLRAALALWRGRLLSDLEDEPFAATAPAQLDEEREETLELRVDADLALGRHDALVPELRALVRRHPLRERLHAQLMLALYRSGRQAEALEAYTAARRVLDEEVGLEPGPELRRLQQAVLSHDPSLELPLTPAASTAAARRSSARVAAVAAVAAVAVVALVLALTGDSPGPPTAPGADEGQLVGVDVASGRITRRVAAGRTPAAVAAGADRTLWVVDADARTVLAVDGATGRSETLATGATPVEVVTRDGDVWVAHGRPQETAQYVGPVATDLIRLDATTRTQRATVALPRRTGTVSNVTGNRLAASSGAVWAVTTAGDVVRVDPLTSAITARNRRIGAVAAAASGDAVWVLRPDGMVLLLDERTARVQRRIALRTAGAGRIAAAGDVAWVTSSADGRLWRVARDGAVRATDVGSGAADVVADGRSAWVANPIDGTITGVSARTGRRTRTIDVGGVPRSLALAGSTVWAAVAGGGRAATHTRVTGVEALPASMCEAAIAGPGGAADALVVSDLPLQGGVRITATQMAQAISFVLRERGFRAGRFRVAYQSCDDSVARTGLFDEAKCAANARAYGARSDVVAVIGTLNSPCAVAAVPELNRARGGPLAMVSPLNSFVGLTRRGAGIPPELPGDLYPTGRRNYLRVFPTDDLQTAALASLVRERGQGPAYVLDDGEPGYGVLMATAFATAASRVGLRVAGRARWDPQARSYRGLAARIEASGARAVFFGGLLDANAAAVIRAVRARMGTGVTLLGPDGLTPLTLLREQAGAAAQDMLVSLPGAVTERLPPAGEAFARRFARAQPGMEVEPSAVYAAQATEVVLDALARSDGTRASVLAALFRTRLRDRLVGDVAFDALGDIVEAPVTVLRVVDDAGSRAPRTAEGGVIERVMRPKSSLVSG